MYVEVVLKGPLAEKAEGGRARVELPDSGTVAAALRALGIAPTTCVCVVNGAAVQVGAPLRDGDRVQVFPQVAGGGA